jgi:hypothetical protein
MDGKMGFRNNYNAAHAMGIEHMKNALHDGGARKNCRPFQMALYDANIIKDLSVTPVELCHNLSA